MSTPTTSEALCALCPNPAPHQCKGCQSIRYCSTICQKFDWKLHKLVCKAHMDTVKSPGPEHVRAMYFPKNGPGPLFVWVCVNGDDLKIDALALGMIG